jgi:predicted dehydrogenase
LALAAAARGIPVLIEKPMTLSAEEARILRDHARRGRSLVMVGHTHLFSAAFRALKRRGAALGPLQRTRSRGGNWGPVRADAPVLWEWGPHAVSMCLELLGAPPAAVRARRAATRVTAQGSGEAIEIELDFGAGRRADIRVSNIEEQKQRVFEAVYAGGALVYDDLAPDKLVLHPATGGRAEPLPLDTALPLAKLVEEFCAQIARGEKAHASLELGVQVVEVLADCQSSIESEALAARASP